MRALSFGEVRDCRRRAAALRGDAQQSRGLQRIDDHVVAVPCTTSRAWSIREGLRYATGEIDTLQLVTSKKPKRMTVWSPEGVAGTLGSRERPTHRLIERSHEQLRSVVAVRHVRQLTSVG